MRSLIFYIILFISLSYTAQDKIYFTDGSNKICKVLSVVQEYVTIDRNGEEVTLPKKDIILIEYKNGMVDVFNIPEENATYSPNELSDPSSRKNILDKYKTNYVSLNSLALCNSDVSGFYEYSPRNIRIGIGAMGAFNFNLYSSAQNAFISSLNNSKKNFDIGVFANFYPTGYTKDMQLFFGIMIKYTDFSFYKSIIDSVPGSKTSTSSIHYVPAKGNQLATLFTVGTTSFINDQFFIKTIAGLGAFKLKGDYKSEFNSSFGSGQNSQSNYLPKLYLGLNIGFNF